MNDIKCTATPLAPGNRPSIRLGFTQPLSPRSIRALRVGFATNGFAVEVHPCADGKSVELFSDTDSEEELMAAAHFFAAGPSRKG